MLAKWSGPLEDGCKCEFELVVVGCRLGRKDVDGRHSYAKLQERICKSFNLCFVRVQILVCLATLRGNRNAFFFSAYWGF